MKDIVTALRLFKKDSNLVNIDLIDETVYINGRKYLRFVLDNFKFYFLTYNLPHMYSQN